LAAKEGRFGVVEYLICHEADITPVTSSKKTLMHFAATGGLLSLFKDLVCLNAEINPIDNCIEF